MKRFTIMASKVAILSLVVGMMICYPAAVGSAPTVHAAPRTSAVATKAAASGGPLRYQGGPVELDGLVYIDYWGSDWAKGFKTGKYTSKQAQAYINQFFAHIGGSAWANITTQYCTGTGVGESTCDPGTLHITNFRGQLAGVYVHDQQIPKHPSIGDIQNEAAWAVGNVFGYNPNATYFVFTPSGHTPVGFYARGNCAMHDETTYNGDPVSYAYLPFLPDVGSGCGKNLVNKKDNGYGNGYFDGLSIFGSHEYAEALTDPRPTTNPAWRDQNGYEIADKCQNKASLHNITLGAHVYAVEALWSNADNGCVMSYTPPGPPGGSFTEYLIPTTGSVPDGITQGPDGALWFTEEFGNQIGRITTTGSITEYALPEPDSLPDSITSGPDGALWFTELHGSSIGRITTTGQISEFPIPGAFSEPRGITSGPDGALWFTDQEGAIGRITTTGSISEYSLPIGMPMGITSGPDGALWFTEDAVGQIGRITTTGSVTYYALAGGKGAGPMGITSGPDGALWFTEVINEIGRITTTGSISEYPIASLPPASLPTGITSGPDGALWFTVDGGNEIGRITTTGSISEYPLPTPSSGPVGITSGLDGALWFTEADGNKIGRITA